MTIHEQGQPGPPDASVRELVERLSTQVSTLVRDEMALATAELKRKGVQAGLGVGIGGVGAVLALMGVGLLVAAATLGLALVVAGWLAALIIGIILLVLAGALSAVGLTRVRKSAPPMPEQAVRSTKQDIQTVKESVHR
jgi:membrane protein